MRSDILRVLIVLAAAIISGTLSVQGGGNQTPASAQFFDDANRIRSDGSGAYDDGVSCVICYTTKGGFFFLRTVKFSCSPTSRHIKLDFSNRVGGPPAQCQVSDPEGDPGDFLNICGTNDVPDVRIIANELFKDDALLSGTSVNLPFSLKDGGDFVGSSRSSSRSRGTFRWRAGDLEYGLSSPARLS